MNFVFKQQSFSLAGPFNITVYKASFPYLQKVKQSNTRHPQTIPERLVSKYLNPASCISKQHCNKRSNTTLKLVGVLPPSQTENEIQNLIMSYSIKLKPISMQQQSPLQWQKPDFWLRSRNSFSIKHSKIHHR